METETETDRQTDRDKQTDKLTQTDKSRRHVVYIGTRGTAIIGCEIAGVYIGLSHEVA